MAAIGTGDFMLALRPKAANWYQAGYNRFAELYKEVFNVEQMDSAIAEDVTMSSTGLFVQTTEGEAVPYTHYQQMYVTRYMPATFKLGVIITREMIEDGKAVKILETRAKNLGISHKETMDILGHLIINRATNGSYVGADGVSLISSSHPTMIGALNSNTPTSAATLSESSIEQMHIDLGNYVDNQGLKLNSFPRKLVIPRALTFEAQRIFGSEFRVGTADNEISAIMSMKGNQFFPDGVVVDNYITAPTAWYVITNENENNGLKCMIRRALEFGEDSSFDNDNVKMKGSFRTVFGWSNPLGIYGCVGPGS